MAVLKITPRRFEDPRGWFSETYNSARYAALGVNDLFVQDNHSFSRPAGTLRGLHFQRPPHAQAKLVRCLRGRIWDVAVDIRAGSPTFGQWVAAELTAAKGEQLYVPIGFAHGFVTLEPDCEVAYKTSALYAPESDAGTAWNDPDVAVAWPLGGSAPELSDKDRTLPLLKGIETGFVYDGAPLTLTEL
ncbi:MAG: dTDP-4-dehydrorhamnose 3,5-epimerase [Sphingomonas sanxanigenens]|uniref:dTDP-4-dehydrorhamnose 3,5-epimerase n=1 Tax=Sphingomonas sanxanigenens TaxID=397260 RepID=A0A2W5AGG2_9SPHN|nr:MAG: dTDP-4-dehydrorhamnose 3,5-epimerase [Sphingomonas sanxanigenens]